MLAFSLLYITFIMCMYLFLLALQDLYPVKLVDFSKVFVSIFLDDHVDFSFGLLILWITLTDFHMLNCLYVYGIKPIDQVG